MCVMDGCGWIGDGRDEEDEDAGIVKKMRKFDFDLNGKSFDYKIQMNGSTN